jgi:hypothetical protein
VSGAGSRRPRGREVRARRLLGQEVNGDWVDRTIQRLPRLMHAPAYIIAILIWWVRALAALAIMPVAAYLISSLLQFRQ